MELQFKKSGSVYVAEATVNKPYNLHLERARGGMFMIYQRGTESGKYAPCQPIAPNIYQGGQVLDWTFDHVHYPMHVRFESETEVTMGTLTEEADE